MDPPHGLACLAVEASHLLESQVINADVPKRSYWRVVFGSAAATQQLSTVIATSVVPVHLRQGSIKAPAVLTVSAVLLVVGEC